MFAGLVDYFCGTCRVSIPIEHRREAFDFMYRETIPFRREMIGGCSVSFTVRLGDAKKLACFADRSEFEICFCDAGGFPVALHFLKKRPILPLGVLLCAIWLLYSQNLVWDIEITGNSKTSESTITEQLETLGFGVGTYYPSVNFNQLHADYAASQNDISWLSVYMNGTVAEIQVRELWEDEREVHDSGVYANIVAAADGIVREVNVFEGQAAVRAGDLVREGQVLISGIVEKKDGGVRYEYAAGEVICETASPIHVEVSCEREEKQYTDREKVRKSIKFFKKTINFFINGGIEYATYDKIDMMEQVCPFGLKELPVWIMTEVYREYENVVCEIPADQAADEAMAQLTQRIREETDGAELVSKTIETKLEDGVYNIDCLLYLNRDIGTTIEFTAEDVPETDDTPQR